MPSPFDLSQNRSPHSFRQKAARLVWAIVHRFLYRPTPKFLFGWRRFLLRLFGARIAPTAKLFASAKIFAPWNLTMGEYSCLSYDVDCYNVAPIAIGSHSTVSQYSYLCTATHDMDDPAMGLLTAPITIGEGVWICADVFVAPGITIGDGAVVGARSSVFADVPAGMVAAGSPCKVLRPRSTSAEIPITEESRGPLTDEGLPITVDR